MRPVALQSLQVSSNVTCKLLLRTCRLHLGVQSSGESVRSLDLDAIAPSGAIRTYLLSAFFVYILVLIYFTSYLLLRHPLQESTACASSFGCFKRL
jgi:hypothetical protein